MPITSAYILLLTALTAGILAVIGRLPDEDGRKACLQQWTLVVTGLGFAAWADIRFALILLGICLAVWLTGRQKKTVRWGILLCLLALACFKYLNFFLESFQGLLGLEKKRLQLLLPLGISFYVFSAVSYLADVGRGKQKPGSFRQIAAYLTFFPKLTSGPIQRAGDFLAQVERPLRIGGTGMSAGAQIFCFGLFKKVVLADRLALFVDQVYGSPLSFGSMTVLLAVFAYTLQIYLDFSGYSDMAIGLARVLGVELPANFNLPYLSHNVTEFWKRWHITLSSWLQDYLYIPLGGSRKGQARTYLNLVLTMVIGGLWHGAGWTFVVWGLLHGLALTVHKLWRRRPGQRRYNGFTAGLSICLTFLFVSFCWIFFRAESLGEAMQILSAIVIWREGVQNPYLWLFVSAAVCLMATAAAAFRSRKNPAAKPGFSRIQGFYPLVNLNSFWGLTWFFLWIGLILGLAYTGGSPFIYGGF